MRHWVVLRILGILLAGFSFTMVPPALLSLVYSDGQFEYFLYSFAVLMALGLGCWLPVRSTEIVLRIRDGFVIVGVFWIVLSTVSAIPFIFSPHLGYVDAVFESVSGFTTTGATVIVGLDDLPRSILYYRQQLQWLGGMGVIVLAVAILPMLSVGGMQLFRAETPGPMKDEKLTPRIKYAATRMYTLYVALTLLCALAYRLAGMNWFDAVGHAFSTLSTGGFSTHDASLGYYGSALIDGIACLFMILGATNFTVHFMAIHGRKSVIYMQDEETRWFLGILVVPTLLISCVVWGADIYSEPLTTLRYVGFQVISVVTTTGFSTASFDSWPYFVPVLLIFLSFVGGCAGSTAGGMKVVRWLLMAKQGGREVQMLVHPSAIIPLRINGRALPERVIASIWGFFALYILTFSLLMLLMMWAGEDQITAFSAIATCMNNLGPGLGSVTTNFVELNNAGIMLSIIAMLLGRLELFTLLVLISPVFWRD